MICIGFGSHRTETVQCYAEEKGAVAADHACIRLKYLDERGRFKARRNFRFTTS